jgi:outer membrane protein OmpA-like peptidoglycan-associated protein/tetratricopeptide (TPR) repeat protein
MLFKTGRVSALIVLFMISVFTGSSQDALLPGQYTTSNRKAIKYFQEGKRYYDNRQDKRAEELFLKAVKEDEKFMEPYMILAMLCQEQRRYKESVDYYKKAIEAAPKYTVEKYYRLAELEFGLGEYNDAKKHFNEYLSFQRINPEFKEESQFKLKCVDFAANARKNPKNVQFVNAGPAINSAESEYFPSITADENYFLYTRRLPEGGPEQYQEDLFLARADKDGSWSASRPVTELSSHGNEGAPSISADGNYMFITISQEMDSRYMGGLAQGYGSCDIFFTQKVNGKWMKPVNLGPAINSSMWESQPSFSSDGKTLYFVRGIRQRTGQITGIDIYYSVIGADGKFTQASKLPGNINTPKDEESVFIHPDNQTLYFSSQGHVGMGGADIFMSKKNPDGTWGDPVNLGYPINSSKDENSLLVAPSGRLAYFASDREGGFGGLDLYQFEVPEDMRPEKITYVKGKVYNAKTNEPLEANFDLFDLDTQKEVTRSYSQKNGEFLATLNASKNYLVNVNKEGYLFYSDNFSLKGTEADFNKPFQLDIPLEPIDVGSVVELKNVFFDVNKWDLKPESKTELDKLTAFLVKNPGLKVELGGHTDNTGDKKLNVTLSSNRAKAVYDYLITNGKIPAARLAYKGYGDTVPKAPNDTPENKAKNRRTEFKVIGK